MDEFAALLVLLLVVGITAVPVAAFVLSLVANTRLSALRRQVVALESEVEALRRGEVPAALVLPPIAVVSAPLPVVAPPVPAPLADAPPSAADPAADPADDPDSAAPPPWVPTPSEPRPSWRPPSAERMAVWLGSGLGAVLLLVAGLLGLALAIEQGWLRPSVRVAMGLCAGSGLWVASAVLRRRALPWLASGMAGAGMGVLYGALYAAGGRYDLLGQVPAFGLMAAVTGVALLGAVRHGDRFTAWLGLLGGLLTPILLSTGQNNALGLFGYLSLLVAGAVFAAWRRGWTDLILGTALGAAVLHAGWTAQFHQADQVPMALLGALLLVLPFALTAGRAPHGPSGPLVVAAASLAALLLPAVILPWVLPVDPFFWDPRTGLLAVRPLGDGWWFAMAGVAILPLPALVAGRLRQSPWLSTAAAVMAALVGLIAAAAWSEVETLPVWQVGLAAVIPLLVGVLVHSRGSRVTMALLPLPVLAALALSVAFAERSADAVAALPLVMVLLGGVALAAAPRPRAGLWAAGLVSVAIALLPLCAAVEPEHAAALAGPALLGVALFAVVPLLRLRAAPKGPLAVADLAGAALAPLLLFGPLYAAWDAAWTDAAIGLLPALLSAVCLLGARSLMLRARIGRDSGLLALFVGVALLGLSAALPVQLDNQWLTVAWAVEAAALAWLCGRLSHPLLRWSSVLLALTVSVRLLLNPDALSYGDTGGLPLLNWQLYTWGVPAVCLLLTAHWLGRSAQGGAFAALDRAMPAVLRLLAVLVGFALVNVEVSDLFQDGGPVELVGRGLLQGMVRSLSWATYGVALLVLGLARDQRWVRLIGFAFVLLATAKVFTVDLWALAGLVRVGSALGLGVSLLLAAFLFERLVNRRDPAPAPDGALEP